MPELPRPSYGPRPVAERLPHELIDTVYCSHGEPVGEWPESIAVLLPEDELVRLQELLLGTEEATDRDLAVKLRGYQMRAFVRFHG